MNPRLCPGNFEWYPLAFKLATLSGHFLATSQQTDSDNKFAANSLPREFVTYDSDGNILVNTEFPRVDGEQFTLRVKDVDYANAFLVDLIHSNTLPEKGWSRLALCHTLARHKDNSQQAEVPMEFAAENCAKVFSLDEDPEKLAPDVLYQRMSSCYTQQIYKNYGHCLLESIKGQNPEFKEEEVCDQILSGSYTEPKQHINHAQQICVSITDHIRSEFKELSHSRLIAHDAKFFDFFHCHKREAPETGRNNVDSVVQPIDLAIDNTSSNKTSNCWRIIINRYSISSSPDHYFDRSTGQQIEQSSLGAETIVVPTKWVKIRTTFGLLADEVKILAKNTFSLPPSKKSHFFLLFVNEI